MIVRRPAKNELEELRGIAELQFDVNGELLIPETIRVAVSPSTGKIRFLILNGKKYLALRSKDYRFNLYIAAGEVLHRVLPHPRLRVYVKSEYVEFVSKGGSLFCKHVLMADPDIRPNDEVLAVDHQGRLVAVGRSRLAGWEMVFYNRGEAVKVREGISKW